MSLISMILDIHSHRPAPYPEGVVCLGDFDAPLVVGQAYSVGIHPWETVSPVSPARWERLEALAADPGVVAIGECGVDLLKGGPLFRQLEVLRRQIELSERLEKPMVLHCVKGADIIMGLKRDLQPAMPWVIHGFRGKPELARQLTSKGILLSFGEKFNPAAVMAVPAGMLLAETDESILTITEIIGSLSRAANRDLTPEIAAATTRFLSSVPEA